MGNLVGKVWELGSLLSGSHGKEGILPYQENEHWCTIPLHSSLESECHHCETLGSVRFSPRLARLNVQRTNSIFLRDNKQNLEANSNNKLFRWHFTQFLNPRHQQRTPGSGANNPVCSCNKVRQWPDRHFFDMYNIIHFFADTRQERD